MALRHLLPRPRPLCLHFRPPAVPQAQRDFQDLAHRGTVRGVEDGELMVAARVLEQCEGFAEQVGAHQLSSTPSGMVREAGRVGLAPTMPLASSIQGQQRCLLLVCNLGRLCVRGQVRPHRR